MCDELVLSLIGRRETADKRSGLSYIIENLKNQKCTNSGRSPADYREDNGYHYDGETPSSEVDNSSPPSTKLSRKRRMDRPIGAITNNNGPIAAVDYVIHNNNIINNNNNNNNHVKNERLSPGTPELSSGRSRSVTPSSASHPDTPPANEIVISQPLPVTGRNYSDFMRSLAAKYNNANPNDAARNGFPPPLDPRFKPSASFPGLLPVGPKEGDQKKGEFPSLVNPFANASMFPPLIDMSTTQTLLAMVRTAKEAEMQTLLRNVKKTEQQQPASPLDLSAAAAVATPRPLKRTKPPKAPSGACSNHNSSSRGATPPKRAQSESPGLHDDVAAWTVEDVCNFVAGIDICAEYAENFREQRIDGSGLPLLTEDHLTSTMNMKLGPALKLRAILAKKLGSCSVCLHCTHCHNSSGSPEPLVGGNAGTGGNTSDSGGPS